MKEVSVLCLIEHNWTSGGSKPALVADRAHDQQQNIYLSHLKCTSHRFVTDGLNFMKIRVQIFLVVLVSHPISKSSYRYSRQATHPEGPAAVPAGKPELHNHRYNGTIQPAKQQSQPLLSTNSFPFGTLARAGGPASSRASAQCFPLELCC